MLPIMNPFRLLSRYFLRQTTPKVFSFLVAASTGFAQVIEIHDRVEAPVTVSTADVTTEITGRFAVTTFDLILENPNARPLEGTFKFPLLNGQSVIRFALDMNGRLREAVPVDKDKGRVVFEEIERRRIDPGLVEKIQGNVYQARIFPLLAHGTRRVVIAYQEDLLRASDQPAYRLALDFREKLKRFNLAITVNGEETAEPVVNTTLDLTLPAWRSGQSLTVERSDFAAQGVLEIKLPPLKRVRCFTGRQDGEEYFYGEAPVAAKAEARPQPRVVGIIWDSSMSGLQRDHDRELKLLDAWFAELGNVDVRLIELRDHASSPRQFQVQEGKWKELRETLEKTIYDGATSLDGLKDDPAVDEWLVFSDGLVDFGPAKEFPSFHGAVHTILASRTSDSGFLRRTADQHFGEFIDLFAQSPGEAVAQLRHESPRVLSVDYDSTACAEVFPETGAPITRGVVTITGILRQPETLIRMKIGCRNGTPIEVDCAVHSGENPSTLTPRAWATAKIDSLSGTFDNNKEDIRRTSEKFGIVTAGTSLIVLETVADYIRYNIEPPDDLRSDWTNQQQAIGATQKGLRESHLEYVVNLFKNRIDWWERKYPKNRPASNEEGKAGFTYAAPGAMPGAVPELRSRDEVEARSRRQVAEPDAPSEETIRLSSFSVSAASVNRDMASATTSDSRVSAQTMDAPGTVTFADKSPVGPTEVEQEGGSNITLQAWSPDAAYMERLKRTPADRRYAIYLEERVNYLQTPGFFLDVGGYFLENNDRETGIRILSNLAEMQVEDPELLRILAYRLMDANQCELAVPLFEKILRLRPEEPQSRRDLALSYAATKKFQAAVDLLWEVVSMPEPDSRFPELELIALGELNDIAATCGQSLDLSKVDPRLLRNLPVGLRVTLTWDSDQSDLDLWVTDPNAEKCFYGHRDTYQGGHNSQDFTQGYGPEEFLLREPAPGTYTMQVNYYGDRRQMARGPITAHIRIITHFGSPDQKERLLTIRLRSQAETITVGTAEFSDKGPFEK